MDLSWIPEANQDRLNRWGQRLISSNATPIILVGVGHGPNQGDIVLCTLEDMPDEYLELLLDYTATKINKERGKQA